MNRLLTIPFPISRPADDAARPIAFWVVLEMVDEDFLEDDDLLEDDFFSSFLTFLSLFSRLTL